MVKKGPALCVVKSWPLDGKDKRRNIEGSSFNFGGLAARVWGVALDGRPFLPHSLSLSLALSLGVCLLVCVGGVYLFLVVS